MPSWRGLGLITVPDGFLPYWLRLFHPGLAVATAVVGMGIVALARWGPPAVVERITPLRLAWVVATALLVLGAQGLVGWAAVVIALALVALVVRGVPGRDSALVPLLLLVSLVGVWAAVPDTEPALVAGVVVGPAVLVGSFERVWRSDRLLSIALVALTAWVGAGGRHELVGGLGCVGLLVVPVPDDARRRVGLVLCHLVLVVVSSRIVTRLV